MLHLLQNTILRSHKMVDIKNQPIVCGTYFFQRDLPTLHVQTQTYLQLMMFQIRIQQSCSIHEPTYTPATQRTDANEIVHIVILNSSPYKGQIKDLITQHVKLWNTMNLI
jgi:hypothetical protein